MGFVRKNSLRQDITARILKDHQGIERHLLGWRKWVEENLFSKDGYRYVVPCVLLLLCLLSIRLPFLDFIVLDDSTAATIIDQRTSNVATIISMTLAVIGLLLGNLAIKDGKSYKMAFVKSRLYFIIYYTLTVIICLIVISTLRNTLSKDCFNRLVLGGTYLAISIPFAIAYLFRTIIKFASADAIMEQFKQAYFAEVKARLFLQLLMSYSKAEFLYLMKKLKIEQQRFQWGESVKASDDEIDVFLNVKEVLIYDIDLSRLERLLNKRKGDVPIFYTTELAINSTTSEHSNFIIPKLVDKRGRKINLSSCLKWTTAEKQLKITPEYEDYFYDKLEEFLKENKPRKVEEVLNFLEDVYDLQMKHG
jgi:hypothetical protein